MRIALKHSSTLKSQQQAPISRSSPTVVLGTALPQGLAVFETSLQSRISSSDTSMTLVSTSTASGEVLPSGYHCFTLDEGRTDFEYVCGTLTFAKTVTALERGLSLLTGTTTVSANQHVHRVGANVKITDFPLIQRMRAQLNGNDTIPNLMTYANTVLITGGSPTTTIATKYYVDNVSIAGASNADETTKGIIELATQIEQASSTALGSTGAALVLQAKNATSSPYTLCSLCIPITQNDGKINPYAYTATSSVYNYNWGGAIVFTGSLLSTGSTTLNAATTSITNLLTVASSTPPPSGFKFVLGGNSYVSGSVNVGTASTSAAGMVVTNGLWVNNNASTTNLTVSGTCTNCATNGYAITTNTGSYDGGTPALVTVNVTCSGSKKVVGGGVRVTSGTSPYVYESYPSASNVWTVSVNANNNGSTASMGTAYAICVNP
jgi:hypothetical protein